MAAEMAEQPVVLSALLERRDRIRSALQLMLPSPLCGATLVARGSSDHAARYARYVFEIAMLRPVSLAAPSIHTIYGARVRCDGYLAVAISQSGRTPEVVRVLREMGEAGAATVAVVNHGDSPLAQAASLVVGLEAGEERAVPATKTFTATLLALAILAEALGPVPWDEADLGRLPDAAEALLDDAAPARRLAERLAGADRVVVTARGLLLGAAEEIALKLRETTGVFAEALSVADMRHGPIAAVTPGVLVVSVSAPGPAASGIEAFEDELSARGVEVIRIGSAGDLRLPASMPEALQPVLATVRGQQLALATAQALGLDPDHPAGLTKVTLTH